MIVGSVFGEPVELSELLKLLKSEFLRRFTVCSIHSIPFIFVFFVFIGCLLDLNVGEGSSSAPHSYVGPFLSRCVFAVHTAVPPALQIQMLLQFVNVVLVVKALVKLLLTLTPILLFL